MPSTSIRRRKIAVKRLKSTWCLNFSKLLVASLPTIVFGIFTVIFTLQQDASARATRQQDQRQADEINRRIIFKEYIDDMKELLFDEKFEENLNKSLLHIRLQTLTVLKNLDINRKHDVILFLYENGLLRQDRLPHVDLHGADLNGMKFFKSSTETCDLSHIYMPGIYAENIMFDSCLLTNGIFNNAQMIGAQFHSCNLMSSSFINTNLSQARFHGNHLLGGNFTSASLVQSSIEGGYFYKLDFTNVDLYQSRFTDKIINLSEFDKFPPNIFRNTRYPNGSFSVIKTDNLVTNGQADSECHKNASSSWLTMTIDNLDYAINLNETSGVKIIKFNDKCFFKIEKQISVYQLIPIHTYSLMIDLEQALVNMTAFIGIKDRNNQDQIQMSVHFLENEGSAEYSNSLIKIIENPSFFQVHSITKPIPPRTRSLLIWFESFLVNGDDQFGLFDQVKLSIFKNKNRNV